MLQATYIIDKLGLKDGSKKGPFNIELFAGSPDDNNTRYFFQGAMKTLQPYLDKKQLVVQSGQTKLNQVTTLRWDGATAQKRMDDLLTKSYSSARVDAVLSPYDGISIGILSALQFRRLRDAAKPYPVVTGQDAEVASVKSIIAGEQTQTVYKDTRALAKQAVQMADAVLNDKTPEVNDTKTYDNEKKVVPSYPAQPGERRQVQLPVGAGGFGLHQGECPEVSAAAPGAPPVLECAPSSRPSRGSGRSPTSR